MSPPDTDSLSKSNRSESYQQPEWPAPPNVRAVFTTRLAGVSAPPFDGFNLGDHVGDDPHSVQRNREQLQKDLAIGTPFWLNQVHGTQVVRAQRIQSKTDDARPPRLLDADASFTGESHVPCAILVADCMPVFVTDMDGGCVGVAHAGWRGLCSGVVAELIEAMAIARERTLVWLGPCIGANHFEVGPEVLDAFANSACFSGLTIEKSFRPGRGDRYYADLAGLARTQLQDMGVRQIFGGTQCTFSNSAHYYSYRRDGQTGRMAALIWIDQ